MSEEEKQQLHQDLYADSLNITSKFQDVLSSTIKSLKERKIAVSEILCNLVGMGPRKPVFEDVGQQAFRCQIPRLKDAKSINEVMLCIGEYSSFFSYQMLKCVIDKLGTDRDKTNLSRYEEDFSKYAKRHVFKCPSKISELSGKGHTNMYFKLDETYENCNLCYLKEFDRKLRGILNVPPASGLKLCTVERGCLKLTFQLPSPVVEEIFPLSNEQEKDLAHLGVDKLWLTYQFSREHHQVK